MPRPAAGAARGRPPGRRRPPGGVSGRLGDLPASGIRSAIKRWRVGSTTGHRYVPRELPDEDLAAHVRVTVLAPASAVVGRVPPDVLIEPVDEGTCVVHAYGSAPEVLALHLGWLDADFFVSGPPELAACLARLAARFAAASPAAAASPSPAAPGGGSAAREAQEDAGQRPTMP